MSALRAQMQFADPPEVVERACRAVIADLGWRVLDDRGRTIVIKEATKQATSFTWAAKVELRIHPEKDGSEVEFFGSIGGIGPIQKGHLKGQMGAIGNKIEVRLREMSEADEKQPSAAPGPAPAAGLSDELERLAGLRDQGVLSEEEFAQAKARLLGG